jgi:lysophospholipase L1-like esterase
VRWNRFGKAAVAVTAAAAPLVVPAGERTPAPWTTAWAAAPAAAVRGVHHGYAGATIRNVVHPTAGGDRVRVHLSNRFGTRPVRFGHVTVAVSAHAGGRRDGTVDASDGTAVPGTVHDVLFAGRGPVTVASGADVVSDPVPLRVAADHDLLVSVWTPEESGTVTHHPRAVQDSFVARGPADHAADPGPAAFTEVTRAWHYVSAVDVAGGPGTVVALGDSITAGSTSTWGANRRWTDYLAARLARSPVPDYGVANAGIGGNRVLLDDDHPNWTLDADAGRSALARLPEDVLDRSGARTLILCQGINDIQRWPYQDDPRLITTGLASIAAVARARGLRVVGATIPPWRGWPRWTPEREATRQAVNAWIRAGGDGAFTAVADFDAAVRDPADPRRLRPAYDSGDHLHPNDAGDAALARAVPLGAL